MALQASVVPRNRRRRFGTGAGSLRGRPRAAPFGVRRFGEREDDILGGLETMTRVLLQTVADDVVQGRRDRPPRVGGVRRLFVQDRRHGLGRRAAREGALAREHLVEDRPEGEEVAAMVTGRGSPARATCSRAVPSTMPGSVPPGLGRQVRRLESARSFCISFARPKSRILTRPSFVTKTFSGFRSRWTMPFSCAAARPLAICIA